MVIIGARQPGLENPKDMVIIGARQPRLENQKDYSLTLKVDKKMNTWLQQYANTHHISKAEAVRMAIQNFRDLAK